VLASNFRDAFPDEGYNGGSNKPVKFQASIELIYSILVFLDASPLALFSSKHHDTVDWAQILEDIFLAFMTFLISDEESIRRLAGTVCRKVLLEGSVSVWHSYGRVLSPESKYNFWNSS